MRRGRLASRISYPASPSHRASCGRLCLRARGSQGAENPPAIAFRGGSAPIFRGILGQGRPESGFALGSRSIPEAVPGGHPLSRGGRLRFSYQVSHTTGVGEKPDEQATSRLTPKEGLSYEASHV